MGLLDTYMKLQGIRQQQENEKYQQLNALAQTVGLISKLDEIDRMNKYRQEVAGIKPYTEEQRPTMALPGNKDVPDPTSMMTYQLPKSIPDLLHEHYLVARRYDPQIALNYLKESRAMREEERRAEKPSIHTTDGLIFSVNPQGTMATQIGGEKKPERMNYSASGAYIQARTNELINQGTDPIQAQLQAAKEADKMMLDRQITVANVRIPPFMPAGQSIPPGYVFNRKTGNFEWRGEGPAPGMSPSAVIDWTALKKSAQSINNPVFKRLIDNAEILAEGVTDPKTGIKKKGELDQIADLRDQIDDGFFGQINNKFQKFNEWDQFVKYQFSDPKMAKFKSKVMASIDTLANIYSGGGTVTSDFKMQFAKDLFASGLSKEAFREKMDTHRDAVKERIIKYSQLNPAGMTGGLQMPDAPLQQPSQPTSVIPRKQGESIADYIKRIKK